MSMDVRNAVVLRDTRKRPQAFREQVTESLRQEMLT
jgi:hypothetical protein